MIVAGKKCSRIDNGHNKHMPEPKETNETEEDGKSVERAYSIPGDVCSIESYAKQASQITKSMSSSINKMIEDATAIQNAEGSRLKGKNDTERKSQGHTESRIAQLGQETNSSNGEVPEKISELACQFSRLEYSVYRTIEESEILKNENFELEYILQCKDEHITDLKRVVDRQQCDIMDLNSRVAALDSIVSLQISEGCHRQDVMLEAGGIGSVGPAGNAAGRVHNWIDIAGLRSAEESLLIVDRLPRYAEEQNECVQMIERTVSDFEERTRLNLGEVEKRVEAISAESSPVNHVAGFGETENYSISKCNMLGQGEPSGDGSGDDSRWKADQAEIRRLQAKVAQLSADKTCLLDQMHDLLRRNKRLEGLCRALHDSQRRREEVNGSAANVSVVGSSRYK